MLFEPEVGKETNVKIQRQSFIHELLTHSVTIFYKIIQYI